jgi:tetratricopeptide (TPR) repeat protein
VKGHALTLNLLGRYLAKAHGGDIRRRDQVKFEKADAKIQGGHAFKAMAAYEKWLAGGGEEGARQLAVLRLLGLFDRPADPGCLAALRREPAIPGFTEPLAGVGEDDWSFAISSLAECGLVSVRLPFDIRSPLDAHPLIREHFSKRLHEETPEAWRAGHQRLYEHLANNTWDKPAPELADLLPLYQAVAHGCAGGLQEKAFADVYFPRIARREEFYSTYLLGAYGEDLAAMTAFMPELGLVGSERLSPRITARVMCQTGYCLRALGRLSESAKWLESATNAHEKLEDWRSAAVDAGLLNIVYILTGELDKALDCGENAVRLADQSDDILQQVMRRAILADTLIQRGEIPEATTVLKQVEEMRSPDSSPFFPALHTGLVLVECELLLLRGLDSEAVSLAEKELRLIEGKPRTKIAIALNHLTIARAFLQRISPLFLVDTMSARTDAESELLQQAAVHLTAAMDGIRAARTVHHLPRVLLASAQLRFLKNDLTGSIIVLDEAKEIAERGPMRLFLADIHLHRAQLFGMQTAKHKLRNEKPAYPWESPGADLAAARRLIEHYGYWRRKKELEDAEKVLGLCIRARASNASAARS